MLNGPGHLYPDDAQNKLNMAIYDYLKENGNLEELKNSIKSTKNDKKTESDLNDKPRTFNKINRKNLKNLEKILGIFGNAIHGR